MAQAGRKSDGKSFGLWVPGAAWGAAGSKGGFSGEAVAEPAVQSVQGVEVGGPGQEPCRGPWDETPEQLWV